MLRSRVALRELEETPGPEKRQKLRADYEALDQVPNDEKVMGFHSQADRRGSSAYPLVSDVQDEKICDEILRRLTECFPAANEKRKRRMRRDAQHITQAVCNGCDVFLTRDCETIIKPIGQWLEQRFPPLRIRRPSVLVAEIDNGQPLAAG